MPTIVHHLVNQLLLALQFLRDLHFVSLHTQRKTYHAVPVFSVCMGINNPVNPVRGHPAQTTTEVTLHSEHLFQLTHRLTALDVQ